MYSMYRQNVAVGGGGVLHCIVDHILQDFYTLLLTRFRTYKIASPPSTKMTSKDDIYGLVSLKFLRPCLLPSPSPRPLFPGAISSITRHKKEPAQEGLEPSACWSKSAPPTYNRFTILILQQSCNNIVDF
jgi:hypothetical protein